MELISQLELNCTERVKQEQRQGTIQKHLPGKADSYSRNTSSCPERAPGFCRPLARFYRMSLHSVKAKAEVNQSLRIARYQMMYDQNFRPRSSLSLFHALQEYCYGILFYTTYTYSSKYLYLIVVSTYTYNSSKRR